MKIIENHNNISINENLESILPSSKKLEAEKLSVSLVNSEEGFDELEMEWNELVKLSGAHIFQTFEWQRIWWKHFGRKYQLHIIVFRNAGELAGIAPFYIERTSLLYKFSYWSLRFIGSSVTERDTCYESFFNYSPSDYLDIIAHPHFEDQITDRLMLYLEKAEDQFNQVDFDEISEESFTMRMIIPEMERRRWPYKKIRKEYCPRIQLPASMNEYLFELSGKTRYELRYSMKAETEKELYRVENADTLQSVRDSFDEFVRLHQKRWNSQGMPGIFINGRFTDFLKEITEMFFNRGWLRFKTARTNDQCLAVNYAFMFNHRVYDYQKGFDVESTLAKYGPGKTLFCNLLQEAIQEKAMVFDLLRGDEKYKMRLANEFQYNWRVILPNTDHKKGLKYRWYRVQSYIRYLFIRLIQENLIIKLHAKKWGIGRFMPNYLRSVHKRMKKLL